MISVIVPFLEEEEYIERCLKSLIDQDFFRDEYELIFIDNGSTDASAEILRRYSRVILLTEPAGNEYAARNKALELAKCDIIAFTIADYVVERNWLVKGNVGSKTIYEN